VCAIALAALQCCIWHGVMVVAECEWARCPDFRAPGDFRRIGAWRPWQRDGAPCVDFCAAGNFWRMHWGRCCTV